VQKGLQVILQIKTRGIMVGARKVLETKKKGSDLVGGGRRGQCAREEVEKSEQPAV